MTNFGVNGNWNIHPRLFHGLVCLFSFSIKPKFFLNWYKMLTPKPDLTKSHIGYVSFTSVRMTPFNDDIIFRLWNLNINDLMNINFLISLITKRFFRYFDRHSDKTVYLSGLLQNIRNFSNKLVFVHGKYHKFISV